MSRNILKTIVIFLGALIILAFIALIYGMYLKISKNNNKPLDFPTVFSLQLENIQKIKNIEVMDKNKLLIIIESDSGSKGAIYDVNKNQIISYIDR